MQTPESVPEILPTSAFLLSHVKQTFLCPLLPNCPAGKTGIGDENMEIYFQFLLEENVLFKLITVLFTEAKVKEKHRN